MKRIILQISLLLYAGIAFSQSIPPDSLYFGQTPPGSIPQIFAPGIVSLPGRNEAVITFSPDGQSVFFYIEKYPQPGNPYVMFSEYVNDHWSIPDTIPFAIGRSTGEPFFAWNGNRLYLWATNAINHHGTKDLSYSEKQGNGWSDPISMGDPPNSEAVQFHPCIVGDSSVYFSSSEGRICRCQYVGGLYEGRVVLPRPLNFIGSQTWGDPYVSAGETYMIIKAIREEGFGENDIYIAYRKPDMTWTNPKNLGSNINTPGDETSGDITPDGLYMTYGSNDDLYWVSTAFIDSLKYTNYLPYVMYPVPDQTAITGYFFSYTVPDSTFVDDDGNQTLSYSATLLNGDPLPSWLNFDTTTITFSGTPSAVEIIYLKVMATDTAGKTASDIFKLTVHLPDGTQEKIDEDLLIYPNPTNGLINISLPENMPVPVKATLFNVQGERMEEVTINTGTSLDLVGKPKGIYMIRLILGKEVVNRRICLF